MNELQAVETWLTTTLTGDADVAALVGARVYRSPAPQGATYPLVAFHLLSSPDRNAVGADGRLFTRPLYAVQAVAEGGSHAGADAIADAVDAALVGADGTVVIGTVTYEIAVAGRMEPIRFAEVSRAAGKVYNHSGGQYRLFVQGV